MKAGKEEQRGRLIIHEINKAIEAGKAGESIRFGFNSRWLSGKEVKLKAVAFRIDVPSQPIAVNATNALTIAEKTQAAVAMKWRTYAT